MPSVTRSQALRLCPTVYAVFNLTLPINFMPMIDHYEAQSLRQHFLKVLDLRLFVFDNSPTVDANQMVVVLAVSRDLIKDMIGFTKAVLCS